MLPRKRLKHEKNSGEYAKDSVTFIKFHNVLISEAGLRVFCVLMILNQHPKICKFKYQFKIYNCICETLFGHNVLILNCKIHPSHIFKPVSIGLPCTQCSDYQLEPFFI